MPERVYLDWNATTPLRPAARAAMVAAYDLVGNPSSVHAEGREARRLVEEARATLAAALGALPRNVVFTFCAQFLMTLHVGTFNSLWFVFLSTPVHDPASSEHETKLPFRFTGGLGLPPRSVGFAMSIIVVVGILMQLLLYPRISARRGST